MHHLEVVLVVTSPDLSKPGNSRFLLLRRGDGSYQLPTAQVGEDQSTIEVAADLLHRLTGLKARILGVGWVDLVPLPLADSVDRKVRDGSGCDTRFIGVPYGAMLPGEIVRLTDPAAKWVPLIEAFESPMYLDHREILQGACHRI